MKSSDRRWARHEENLFWKATKLKISSLFEKLNVVTRKRYNNLTAKDLSEDSIKSLFASDRAYAFTSAFRNSPEFFRNLQNEFFAMVRTLGPPQFFITFSMSESRWPDLLRLLYQSKYPQKPTPQDHELLTLPWLEVCSLIQTDPVRIVRHFVRKLRFIQNQVLKSNLSPIGKVVDFKSREEDQKRGTLHDHGIYYVENAPVYGESTDASIVTFIDKAVSCSLFLPDIVDCNLTEADKRLPLVQIHKHSANCKRPFVCRTGFPQPPLPKTMILRPLENDITSSEHASIFALHKIVYTFLNAPTKVPPGEDCTSGFNEMLTRMNVSYTDYLKAVRYPLKRPAVFLRREPNATRVNAYNPLLLYLWRSNMDIQYNLDAYAVAKYICSYIAKAQKNISRTLKMASDQAKNGLLEYSDQLKEIARAFIKHEEIGAQMAALLVLQLPITVSTRSTLFVNTSPPEQRVRMLKSHQELAQLHPDSTEVYANNLFHYYTSRPRTLENLCLADFAAKFVRRSHNETFETSEKVITWPNKAQFYKLKRNRILRYVRFDIRKDPENHYRELLLLFHPFRDEMKILGNSDTFEQQYHLLKEKIEAKRVEFEHWRSVTQRACDEIELLSPDELERINTFLQDEDENLQTEAVTHLDDTESPIVTIGQLPALITEADFVSLIASFNPEQSMIFHSILHELIRKSQTLRVFVTGGAGTGKTVLVQALYQAISRTNDQPGRSLDQPLVLLCSYTGIAASHIKGTTIHSALGFTSRSNNPNELLKVSRSRLHTLQIRYQFLQVVIIDETSFLGSNFLCLVDYRLREIRASTLPFGGLTVLFFGDLYQLPPVKDRLIFQQLSDVIEFPRFNVQLWKLFSMFELKIIMRQSDDLPFAELLSRVRTASHTVDDIRILESRIIPDEIHHPPSLRICHTNQRVAEYNERVSSVSRCQSHTILAIDNISREWSTAEVQNDALSRKISKMTSHRTGNLETSLCVATGARVMLTCNLNLDDSLCNGKIAVLRKVQLTNGEPVILWLHFENSDVGQLQRIKHHRLYRDGIQSNWVPIFKLSQSFDVTHRTTSTRVTRIQFPVVPASAITIHKSQGELFLFFSGTYFSTCY